MEFNDQIRKALHWMDQTHQSVFVTGRAGTGKSTLLNYFRDHTEKKIVVLAPTGVAALNVRGETIHSFFRFKPDITLRKVKTLRKYRVYKALDAIVIDEVSMLRADLVDCVDRFMRLNGPRPALPFGGVQMIFVGDLYQLPPVVTSRDREVYSANYASPYFFEATVMRELKLEFVELEKVYRQHDPRFIALLNKIRNNSADENDLRAINERAGARFSGPLAGRTGYCIHLTTTNEMASRINEEELSRLKGELRRYRARVDGDFDHRSYPTDEILGIRPDAQVMMLNNDSLGRWVNGSLGRIAGFDEDEEGGSDLVCVAFEDGRVERVSPFEWDIFHFKWDEKKKQIDSDIVGSFMQYPMKLAWAVTIHKSQGKTFDRVKIDFGRGTFAHGQMYVALSRSTSLEGIVLAAPIRKGHILMDRRVVNFLTRHQYALSESRIPLAEKVRIIRNAIDERKSLEIVYLKTKDEKSRRTVKPLEVGRMEYMGKIFTGMEAYCLERSENRCFRVDRILELNVLK